MSLQSSSSHSDSSYLFSTSEPLSADHDVLLLDLDGTTYLGKIAAPNAPEALATAKSYGARTMYLTNNSGRAPEVVAAQLNELGIPTLARDVLNSSQVAVIVAEQLLPAGAPVLLVGAEGLRDAFEQSSLTVVQRAEDHPQAVIQGLNEQATWSDLSEAVLAISKWKCVHIATNMDATIPKERGLMIGNGSFVACVQHATGSEPISCGKPEPLMFNVAVERTAARRPLAVGDRLNTDVAGANAAGIPCFHVLTGVASAGDILLAKPTERPRFLGVDLRDLNAIHPPVLPDPPADTDAHTWQCNGWLATVENGQLVITNPHAAAHISIPLVLPASEPVSTAAPSLTLDGAGSAAVNKGANSAVKIPLNAYRAAACAMWAAADSGSISAQNVHLPELVVTREAGE
ncbi:MAG: HAD-IIA family hydrolase [Arcanobacterium sp.]|nr:HAD-IIA family hydrolase [Arcanobacterium sp.]